MKVRSSVKKICNKCRIIKRHGRGYGYLFKSQT